MESAAGGPPARKLQKVSHQGTGAGADDDDYSNSVLRKLNASSRTGQACDRCKVRKIRCDSTAGGCSPCRQAQATCKTTDRITGRATIRGHTDKLEAENLILRAKVNEQHRKLLDAGIPVDDLQIHAHNTPFASTSPVGSVSGRVSAWDAPPPPNGNHSPFGPGPASASASAPAPRTRGFFDQFSSTNVAAQPNTGLSIFRGTKMSLFGWQCDLTELVDEAEDPDSPTSYDGFMKHIFHRVPPTGPAPLPPTLEDAKPYANWYFNFLNAYTPVLHKPDMFALLAEVYTDPTPGPRQGRTVAQEVMLHMMFCQIKYQTGQRNRRTAAMDEAMAHFKYSLKFWFELCQSQTLQDVQALAMITVQLRNFPAPGAAWYATQNVLSLAVELGLHRSANAWSAIDRREMSEHEIEMRKRVFWILYGLSVGINVRLGRPAPMRADDIDIEFPRPVNDNLPEEEDRLSEFGKCTFHVGISVCRILALFGEMYTTLYTVRGFSPQQYDAHVARLEADLRTWRSLIHPELVDPDRAKGEAQVFSLFLSFFDLEFQFFLRHPVIFPPANQVQYRANLVTTLGVITKMLGVLSRIRDVKCLDVPWITVIVFLASIFTALFAQDQRKDEITQQEVTQLGDDMEVWIGILGDVAVIHGKPLHLVPFSHLTPQA
ncbi:hypothetical protein EJ06DRAFT_214362 [Trichodelitschia bisporula]|uniref:Zn(2)-C6 fungal-type domain-containing protein n=1 Tax=Trichodelitschia bisporula TaxID=703511 RepID=A0A6G1I900_9PEZI|nr:hypothetical protein EJ06DRAFT_214362 [Trichodelitschia bisporula]